MRHFAPAHFEFLVRTAALVLAPLVCLNGDSTGCAQPVHMQRYSVCLPTGWHVETTPGSDKVGACNKQPPCTGTGGGFPLAGVVFLFVFPADQGPGHPHYDSARDLAASVRQLGATTVEEVHLRGVPSVSSRDCWISRSLMLGKVWNDVYGLRVGSTVFRAASQYNNEPAKVALYRDAVIGILSSVALRDDATRRP